MITPQLATLGLKVSGRGVVPATGVEATETPQVSKRLSFAKLWAEVTTCEVLPAATDAVVVAKGASVTPVGSMTNQLKVTVPAPPFEVTVTFAVTVGTSFAHCTVPKLIETTCGDGDGLGDDEDWLAVADGVVVPAAVVRVAAALVAAVVATVADADADADADALGDDRPGVGVGLSERLGVTRVVAPVSAPITAPLPPAL
ncbi:MAG TPA: hypothetical protein VH372_06780 [Actinospica sp.]|nr:hypothetical protein [Actinospica sp.]